MSAAVDTSLQVDQTIKQTDTQTGGLTFVTFAEAGTHGLRTAGRLSVHHGGLRMRNGEERKEGKGGREGKEANV